VDISWTPASVDSSKAGNYEFEGTVEGYNKTVKLKLKIKPRVSIEKIDDIEVEIKVGDSFTLPTQVEALMSDDSTKQVDISWTPATVNTNVAGSFSFSGQVEGYASAVSLLLVVKAISPPPPPPPPVKLASPTANLPAGTYGLTLGISLSSETSGASIYYTTDSSDPRTSETRKLFNEAIIISDDTIIKAYAKKEGMADSDLASFSYNIAFKLDAVFLSYDLSECRHFWGDLLFFFNAPVDPSTIGIANLTPGATEPVQVNLLAQNGNSLFADLGLGSFSTDFAFSGSGNFSLMGKAYLSSDSHFLVINIYGDADEGSFTLGQGQFTPNSNIKSNIDRLSLDSNPLQCTSAQVFFPSPGSICSTSPTSICGSTASNQTINDVKVEIITLDASSPRYLRQDNNEWHFGEGEYRIPLTPTGPSDNPWSTWSLDLNQAQQEAILATEPNVCYIAVWVELSNISGSLANIGRFTIQTTQDQVAAPTANPPAGTYSTAQSVSLSSETSGASIYYTTDSSDPRTSETRKLFNEAFTISTNTTIEAYAKKEGMADSDVAIFSYTIEAPPVCAYVYSVTPTTLYEVMDGNGGSLAPYYLNLNSPGIIVNIANGTLKENISVSDYVYHHNLPTGLSVGDVRRLSSSKLYIAIDGVAANHGASDSISNLSFTIAQDAVDGATADLTTGPISIIFDPDPNIAYISSVGPYELIESQGNDGTLDSDCQNIYVNIANGSLQQGSISKDNVIVNNLPDGFDYEVSGTGNKLCITITGAATNHGASDSIDNLSFTIRKDAVDGANADLTTGNISIIFNDSQGMP